MTITSEVTLPTGDGPMTAYRARPDGQARGAVIVVQEAFGVNPHIQDVTRRFAAAGWDAIAPAFFHRQGSPVLDYDDLANVMPLLGQMTPAGLAMDLNAAVDRLRPGYSGTPAPTTGSTAMSVLPSSTPKPPARPGTAPWTG